MPDGAEPLELPFSSVAIDRAGHRRRDDAWLEAAVKDPESRLLEIVDGSRVFVGDGGRIAWSGVPEGVEMSELIFLGLDESSRALFARDRPTESVAERALSSTASLRDVMNVLDDVDAAAALQAFGLTAWHRRHSHCAACGAPTLPADAGHVRRCSSCGSSHFPRMDPAVIMLVSDGDACVLGRRSGAPGGRWSTLAGYVEPGESPEVAVAREVHEEVGLVVTSVRYRGSQPWPFPASLMLAFEATAPYGPLSLTDEHEEVRWFTRSELSDGLADGSIATPGPIAAGSFLIRSWLA